METLEYHKKGRQNFCYTSSVTELKVLIFLREGERERESKKLTKVTVMDSQTYGEFENNRER